MARPTKHDEPMTEFIRFRIAPTAKHEWLKKVSASGMSESDFFRDCVLTNKTQIIAKTPQSKEKSKLVYLFNKVGNNINQLAYRANSDFLHGKLGKAEYDRLIFALESIVQWHHKVIKDVD